MEPARVPLIITVTGHRNLYPDDVPRVESELKAFLEALITRYKHTPLVLLSPLGPGADRLAAKVATEVPGIELVATLAWPAGVCDGQRHRGGDKGEFDALLGKARQTLCLPLPDGMTASELCASPERQQECFAALGRYIARHSQGLVAIWDGNETDTSQTWQMIRWHTEGTPAPFAAGMDQLDEPETGPFWRCPVRHLPTDPPVTSAGLDLKKPTKGDFKAFDEIATSFDRFNLDVVAMGPSVESGMAKAKSYVFPEEEQKRLPAHLRHALDCFALADQLSVQWQRRSLWLFILILGLIFVMVSAFECYAHVAPGNVALLVAYPFLFGIGWAAVWAARRLRIYNRYLDDRALAEAMRVHLFWKLAGLRESAADYYLRSCRSQLDWIRAALRAWTVMSGEHDCRCACAAGTPPDSETLQLVRKRWMKDQQTFFAKNTTRDHERAHRCHWWARAFLMVSLAATAVQSTRLILEYVHGHGDHAGHDGWTHALIMIIAMGGVLAGLCHEYLEKRLFEKQSRSYQWMASLYQTALNRFDALLREGKTKEIRDVIRELGREALAENADWVIYHREREPEMHSH